MKDLHSADTVEFKLFLRSPTSPPQQFSSQVQVDLAGLTNQGKVRANNEDHFFICRYGRFLETVQTNLPADDRPGREEETGYAMVVADGVGGCAAGEEASRLAISILVNLVLHTPDWILRLDDDAFSQFAVRRAVERVGEINRELIDRATENPALQGYATTMTFARSLGADLLIAHLGDSRAYLYRQGRLQQLTHDHTAAQELADLGLIARQEVPAHPLRRVLTQCLGDHSRALQPEIQQVKLEDGDRVLLCTDGLTTMVQESAIAEVLADNDNPESLCRRLIDRALEAGGADNVTVIVASYLIPRAGP
jgi:protein phosphatase